jgi:hypothetical protein
MYNACRMQYSVNRLAIWAILFVIQRFLSSFKPPRPLPFPAIFLHRTVGQTWFILSNIAKDLSLSEYPYSYPRDIQRPVYGASMLVPLANYRHTGNVFVPFQNC